MSVKLKPFSGLYVPPWVAAEVRRKHAAAEVKKAELQEKLESNAEFQRNKIQTPYERGRKAVEKMVETTMTREKLMKGEAAPSEEVVREKVQQMQDRYEKNK